MRKWATTFILICTALLLSGCIDFEYKIRLNEDGSGLISYKVLADTVLLGMSGNHGLGIEDSLETMKQNGFQATQITEGDKSGYLVEKAAKDLVQSLAIADGLEELDSLISRRPGEGWNVVKSRHRIEYDIDFDLDLSTSESDSPGSSDWTKMLSGSMLQSLDFSFILILPQPALESNAASVSEDGRTHTWKLTPGTHNPIRVKVVFTEGIDLFDFFGYGSFWDLVSAEFPGIMIPAILEPFPWGPLPYPWKKSVFPTQATESLETEQRISWGFDERKEEPSVAARYRIGKNPTDWIVDDTAFGWEKDEEKFVWNPEEKLIVWKGKWNDPEYVHIFRKGNPEPEQTWVRLVGKPGFYSWKNAKGEEMIWGLSKNGLVYKWTAYDTQGEPQELYRIERDSKNVVIGVQYWSNPSTKEFEIALARSEKSTTLKAKNSEGSFEAAFNQISVPSTAIYYDAKDKTELKLEYVKDDAGKIAAIKEYRDKRQVAKYSITRDKHNNVTKVVMHEMASLFGETRTFEKKITSRTLTYLEAGVELPVAIEPIGVAEWLTPPEKEIDWWRNKPTIGVAIRTFDDTFTSYVRNAITENAADKAEVEVVDSQNAQPTQNDQVDSFLTKKMKAIAINPVDRTAAAAIIDKAKGKKTPVVFFNREPLAEDMAKWNKVYYVGSKAELSGTLQGQIVVDYWKANPDADKNKDGKIQYIMLKGEPGQQDAELRTAFSIRAVADAGIEVEKLAEDTAFWDRPKAFEKMKAFLADYGDAIEVVFCNNDDMALGAIEALKSDGYFNGDKQIAVVGVDATAPAIQAIEEGTLLGTVLDDAKNQGKAIFDLVYYLAMGKEADEAGWEISEGKYIWVPHQMVTKDNFTYFK